MEIPAELEPMLEQDIEFTQEIHDKYSAMLKKLAWFYTDDTVLFADLMQEGWIGVHLACDQYTPIFGATLTTYVYQRARAKMQQYMNYRIATVHVPIAKKEEYKGHVVTIHAEPQEHTWSKFAPEQWVEAFIDSKRADDLKKEAIQKVGLALEQVDDEQLLRRRFVEGESVASLTTEYGVNRDTINERIEMALAQARLELNVWRAR